MNYEMYIRQLGLPLLQKKGNNFNFRCVICGDSKKSKTKKRGWILIKNDKATYYCHNCHVDMSFWKFLEENYPDVFMQYKKERFKNKRKTKDNPYVETYQTKADNDVDSIQYQKLDLPTLWQLPDSHEAKQYFIGRKLPERFLKYFYYTDNFFEYANTVEPDKFENIPNSDERIVIPLYTLHRKIFAMQGRALYDSKLRYITIKFDENHPKVFGLERVNPYKDIMVFEGAFDSLFMPNAIACAGADLDFEYLDSIASKDRYIFCYDIEARNKQICDRVEVALKAGYRVCLLPHKIRLMGKDVNKLIENGMTRKQIYDMIYQNIFEGKKGLIKLKFWRKTK